SRHAPRIAEISCPAAQSALLPGRDGNMQLLSSLLSRTHLLAPYRSESTTRFRSGNPARYPSSRYCCTWKGLERRNEFAVLALPEECWPSPPAPVRPPSGQRCCTTRSSNERPPDNAVSVQAVGQRYKAPLHSRTRRAIPSSAGTLSAIAPLRSDCPA